VFTDRAPSASSTLVAALCRRLGATLVQTHISWVLLDGMFAWKIKKPVRLSFLDFSELATRRRLCEEELRLNRRLAPALYLDVVPIGGTPDAPQLASDGPAIEYALRMQQFAAGALLSERLAAGTLQPLHLDRLAQRLAAFHRAAAMAAPDSLYGTPRMIEDTALQVLDGLAQCGCAHDYVMLRRWLLAEGARLHDTWLRRRAEGRVREGHGDLHLANAVVLGDEATAFDCIEFDPALRWIDVLSDIAFLVMDLLAHERGDLAFRFLNAYLDDSGDHAGVPVLRYHLVQRSLVRALVTRLQGGAGGPDYLGLAQRLTEPPDARLLITHGVSGSGKSVAAQALLEQAQAIRLRSDVERKRLFGLAALDDSVSRVPGGVYGADATRHTYARLRELAAIALDAGHRVIVDAAFLRSDERDDFRRLARDKRVPFGILHCEAPPELLRERVRARRARADDASEADVSVLERQLVTQQPLRAHELAQAITVDSALPLTASTLAARWLAC
jgi:aminoglycoside phosphotransferase family enzyme/predicted kinase